MTKGRGGVERPELTEEEKQKKRDDKKARVKKKKARVAEERDRDFAAYQAQGGTMSKDIYIATAALSNADEYWINELKENHALGLHPGLLVPIDATPRWWWEAAQGCFRTWINKGQAGKDSREAWKKKQSGRNPHTQGVQRAQGPDADQDDTGDGMEVDPEETDEEDLDAPVLRNQEAQNRARDAWIARASARESNTSMLLQEQGRSPYEQSSPKRTPPAYSSPQREPGRSPPEQYSPRRTLPTYSSPPRDRTLSAYQEYQQIQAATRAYEQESAMQGSPGRRPRSGFAETSGTASPSTPRPSRTAGRQPETGDEATDAERAFAKSPFSPRKK
ncbi:hypothetical protein K491DRAFT_782322 [Lophiostoma macrostomum CBS 122681]|uniref:Uncharacterized protein n=1 Tax=Lophiostoma macrostomum CBS 122681 TaxID=1314788 RepID=A0A6A6SXE3_9PLEO|nr:hypothetical protein K491DRAFT_782322 [Lophiostoma macrostomum CBS 122681]